MNRNMCDSTSREEWLRTEVKRTRRANEIKVRNGPGSNRG